MSVQSVELAEPTSQADESRYEKYDSAPPFLAGLAASEFGVHFSDKTVANWTQALRAVFEADNIFERNDQDEKEHVVEALIGFKENGQVDPSGINPDAVREIMKLKDMVSEEQGRNFIDKCLQIIVVTQTFRYEKSVKEFSRLTMLEGQLLVTALVHLVEPADRQQEGYQDFVRFWRMSSRVANQWDSIWDLKTDYSEGISAVRPTIANRTIMLWESMPAMVKSVKMLGFLATAQKIPRAAYRVFSDRKRTPDE